MLHLRHKMPAPQGLKLIHLSLIFNVLLTFYIVSKVNDIPPPPPATIIPPPPATPMETIINSCFSTSNKTLQDCPSPIVSWDPKDQKSQVDQEIIIYEKYFKNKCFGTFLEMGAHDGIFVSNSWFFEKVLGWRGVCVEPNPINYAKLIENRPLCIDLNVAVTNKREKIKFMAIEGHAAALSGIVDAMDPQHTARIEKEMKAHGGTYRIVDIPGVPLHTLLEDHNIHHVDFFSLDTEGSELIILQSVQWDKVSIDVIVVENNYGDDKVRKYLESVGYKRDIDLVSDEIFVKIK